MKLKELVKGQEYAVQPYTGSVSRTRMLLLDDKMWHLARPGTYSNEVYGPGRYKSDTPDPYGYGYAPEMGLIMASPTAGTYPGWTPKFVKISQVKEEWGPYSARKMEEQRLRDETTAARQAEYRAYNDARDALVTVLKRLAFPGGTDDISTYRGAVRTTEDMMWLTDQLRGAATAVQTYADRWAATKAEVDAWYNRIVNAALEVGVEYRPGEEDDFVMAFVKEFYEMQETIKDLRDELED